MLLNGVLGTIKLQNLRINLKAAGLKPAAFFYLSLTASANSTSLSEVREVSIFCYYHPSI